MAENGTVAIVATIPNCDVCQFENGATIKAKYDARMNNGQWGYLCEAHYRRDTKRILGIGFGQELRVK